MRVVFNSYQPISTGVYIKDGEFEYIIDVPEPEAQGAELADIVVASVLKVYREDYDTHVYQIEDRLYWLIGKDFDVSIIYHLFTNEPDNLSEKRQ